MKLFVKDVLEEPITPEALPSGSYSVFLVRVDYNVQDGTMYLVRIWGVVRDQAAT